MARHKEADERPSTEPNRTSDRADDAVPSRRSAAPPLIARIAAFMSVLIAGLCGGLIGFAVTDIQFGGDNQTIAGIGGLVGALGGAIGVAIVATLVLRSMGEWKQTT